MVSQALLVFQNFSELSMPCSNTELTWAHSLPEYVGRDYFCDSDSQVDTTKQFVEDENDPLWDGQGCGPTSSCCEFNNPPYFCKHLNHTTSEDMEMRRFNTLTHTSTKGKYFEPAVSVIEIYAK